MGKKIARALEFACILGRNIKCSFFIIIIITSTTIIPAVQFSFYWTHELLDSSLFITL